jgi:drug/metabolite transporter (DMT)-like permease
MATPLSSMMLVAFGSFIGSFGAVFLKSGATRLRRSFSSLVHNWQLAAGIFFFLLSSVFFVLGLREGELSVLYPMVSLGYVWTLLWSKLFFGERMTRTKITGLALILFGVLLVGMGTERTRPGQQSHVPDGIATAVKR